jgi:electron transfer flavoprotein alpha subunit
MSGILVIAEIEEGAPTSLTFEMLGLANTLKGDGSVQAVVLGQGIGGIGEALIAQGADQVFAGESESFAPYMADAWLPDVVKVAQDTNPDVILCAHTNIGWDLAPRLAFRLGTSVATGCDAVEKDGDKVLMTRACYGGKAREQISFTTSPAIATVKSKTQDVLKEDTSRSGEVTAISSVLDANNIRARVVEQHREQEEGVRLETAKTVVAGGGGLGGPEGFTVAKELADLLGGAIGASRVAVELDWCPHSWQVGLSGKTVAPDLYIAIGISGAGQHMAGCANSGTIVAINQDRDAAIFDSATYGIVMGYEEVVPALIEEIRKIKAG